MSISDASGRRRAVALVAVGLAVAAGVTGLATRAVAEPVLPPLSAEELLTRMATAEIDGLTATFEQRSDLGLPALPSGSGASGDELATAVALLTGDHTVRVWLDGPERARAALVDGSTETAVIRNGADVWTWSSAEQTARHTELADRAAPTPSPSAVSPTEAIQKLLEAVGPTTELATSGAGYVAGRPVYQLLLTPKDDASLVRQVRVSVDAVEFVPLGLRVVADDGTDAITVAATSVDFGRPDAAVFTFTPPPGAEVVEEPAPTRGERPSDPGRSAAPTVVGTGWTAVAVTGMDADRPDDEVTAALLESLPEVSGPWGRGRLLSTVLVTAVITDDGRVAVGSVEPERLYAALAAR